MDLDPFISRGDLAAALHRPEGSLDDDDLALIATDAACGHLRKLTGQTFNENETVVNLDGSGTRSLLLPQTPVDEISSVLIDGEAIDPGDYIVTDAGVLRRTFLDGRVAPRWSAGWARGQMNVEVTYSHGFGEVPSDLRMLALTIAARIYEQNVARQETVAGSTTTYSVDAALDLTRTEKLIVRRYSKQKAPAVSTEAGS